MSFHFEYNDYLDEIGCIDPATAKENAARAKKQTDIEQKPEGAQGAPPNLQGAECEIEEMEDPNDCDAGRFKFDNVLKSMVARLELYNGLAPIQEYGRH